MQARLDSRRRERSAAGMVLVRHGRAEQSHEAVASELIDGALVAMNLGERYSEESVKHVMHALCSNARRQPGRVDDVAEQDRNLLALAFECTLRREDFVG